MASHVVIGTGPLQFFADPGATGLELSAINRIQTIYREHGFRTAAGEGGEPFGETFYPRSLFVAWQFRHRDALGQPDATLSQFAAQEQITSQFAQHVWETLTVDGPAFPMSEIVASWESLPSPTAETNLDDVRTSCGQIASSVLAWQRRLAGNTGDDEEAALLTHDNLRLTPSHSFRAIVDWEENATSGSVHLAVASASDKPINNAKVVWKDPRLRFSFENRTRSRYLPLRELVPAADATRLPFVAKSGADGANDLQTSGRIDLRIKFNVPKNAIAALLVVEADLQANGTSDDIVRCTVKDGFSEGDTAADTGEVSAILGRGKGDAFEAWKQGVVEFAQALPDVSQREPAPSDRDPIPWPFDGTYNSSERNEFHYTIKYHRDDDFFVRHMIDDQTRRKLDQAWFDLLTAFDYHDTYLQFIARKFDRKPATAASLTPEWVKSFPLEAQQLIEKLAANYSDAQAALRNAQAGHVQDAVRFADAAWRRKLTSEEGKKLQAFYTQIRQSQELDHADAIRALFVRILVAPEFLYRVERGSSGDSIEPLDQWELASRLSYFLWSSPPDEELRRAAERGELADDRVLESHVRRMLQDPKAKRFATEFFGQWFGFYRFPEHRGIDAERFPEFDENLKQSMYDESIAFFEHLVRENRPVSEILFADYAYLDQRLAKHYGIADGSLLQANIGRVENTRRFNRGGLLGLATIQTVTSAPLRTSAVKRGDWVLRRVLGTPVPPPPADAGSIPADDVATDGKTVRELLVAHRTDASCVNCHSRMDPLGFAMENFDPIGRWRDEYRDGQSIDAGGTLHDGTVVKGFDGLQKYLRDQLPSFYQTTCSKLIGYALGRSELLTDRLLAKQMMSDIERGGGFADLAVRVATSPQFKTKRGVHVSVSISEKTNAAK
ncbi:MAG: DUF1592 domain-containing protein [Planctomycetales bacterium]|nr:DUF1592 domain-containing protein [Planctomycetales bacterium]